MKKHEFMAQTHLILTLTLWTSCFQNKESCLDKLKLPHVDLSHTVTSLSLPPRKTGWCFPEFSKQYSFILPNVANSLLQVSNQVLGF